MYKYLNKHFLFHLNRYIKIRKVSCLDFPYRQTLQIVS